MSKKEILALRLPKLDEIICNGGNSKLQVLNADTGKVAIVRRSKSYNWDLDLAAIIKLGFMPVYIGSHNGHDEMTIILS